MKRAVRVILKILGTLLAVLIVIAIGVVLYMRSVAKVEPPNVESVELDNLERTESQGSRIGRRARP
ncbi:MAG: hypothetical protein HC859_16055 [Bacteroidia bacterium]|nr:hypothetical protein [Bacteroidia bacterium]